jgi:hypothetical protein
MDFTVALGAVLLFLGVVLGALWLLQYALGWFLMLFHREELAELQAASRRRREAAHRRGVAFHH